MRHWRCDTADEWLQWLHLVHPDIPLHSILAPFANAPIAQKGLERTWLPTFMHGQALSFQKKFAKHTDTQCQSLPLNEKEVSDSSQKHLPPLSTQPCFTAGRMINSRGLVRWYTTLTNDNAGRLRIFQISEISDLFLRKLIMNANIWHTCDSRASFLPLLLEVPPTTAIIASLRLDLRIYPFWSCAFWPLAVAMSSSSFMSSQTSKGLNTFWWASLGLRFF